MRPRLIAGKEDKEIMQEVAGSLLVLLRRVAITAIKRRGILLMLVLSCLNNRLLLGLWPPELPRRLQLLTILVDQEKEKREGFPSVFEELRMKAAGMKRRATKRRRRRIIARKKAAPPRGTTTSKRTIIASRDTKTT
jgi:hypothetical protein